MTLIITAVHARRAGYCLSNCRPFFARHGLDFRDFIRNGIDAEKLLATGDDMAARVVALAQRDAEALTESEVNHVQQ